MWPTYEILAQKPSFEWENLLYILIFLILPALKGIGDWVRKKVGNEEATQDEGDATYEVTMGENDEFILKPAPTARKPMQPVRTPAQSQAARPSMPDPAPARSTTPIPLAPPAPQRRPATRAIPKTPQPARAHPARAARRQPAQSARAAHGRVASAVESHSLLEEEAVEALLLEEQDSLRDTHAAHDLIANETFDAQSLKKAFILSEILAPPLAIRPTGNSLFSQLE